MNKDRPSRIAVLALPPSMLYSGGRQAGASEGDEMQDMRTGWVFEGRGNSGWETVRGYKGEVGAMNALRRINNSQPFRVVFRAADGATTIHATRN